MDMILKMYSMGHRWEEHITFKGWMNNIILIWFVFQKTVLSKVLNIQHFCWQATFENLRFWAALEISKGIDKTEYNLKSVNQRI